MNGKRIVSIGAQGFDRLRERNCFLVDKSSFIREWWKNDDTVTLITRPRRFGKTLNMSMTECFFSNRYAGRADLFEGLDIWEDEEFRGLQGAYPVISLTFSSIKSAQYEEMVRGICSKLRQLYETFRFLTRGDLMSEGEKDQFEQLTLHPEEAYNKDVIEVLCGYLYRHTGKKVIVLLDEYDAPMQEAWLHGYWDEAVQFFRGMFNATFKENPYLERAIITGVTRISKESLFSDLNNLTVASVLSPFYEISFGFTGEEVFAAMDEYGYTNKEEVRRWYDGFSFGRVKGIYNPWSVTYMLKSLGETKPYWANTSSNALAGRLIREGSAELKQDFETLMHGGTIESVIDEEIVFKDMASSDGAIWSILLASGYVKAKELGNGRCSIELTNHEVKVMFEGLVRGWFSGGDANYGAFIKWLLKGEIDAMNRYMNDVALATFSSFDTGNRPSEITEPERFYHGFVLGLMVELKDRYMVTSNRESGYGRYDIMLEPEDSARDDAIIIEFKVRNENRGEKSLEDTAKAALLQIREKQYAASLISKGIAKDRIRSYGFAFEGKKVLIAEGEAD